MGKDTNLANLLMDIYKTCFFHPFLPLGSSINGFAKLGACFAHTLNKELGVWCFLDGPVIAQELCINHLNFEITLWY